MQDGKFDCAKLRKTLLGCFQAHKYPELMLGADNYLKLENAVVNFFKYNNNQTLLLMGNKEAGKRMAFRKICNKHNLVHKVIYINLKLYKDELSLWNRLRREFDCGTKDLEEINEEEKETLVKNMETFFQNQTTAIYMDNLEALVKVRQDFLYTFIEDLQACIAKAFVCFSTANLNCLDSLERRVKSRLQFMPLHFAYNADVKAVVDTFLKDIKSTLRVNRLFSVVKAFQSNEVVALIDFYYQISNNIGNIFKIMSSAVCMFSDDDLKRLVHGSTEECTAIVAKNVETAIKNFGAINYEEIFASMSDLNKSVLCNLIPVQQNSGEITISNLIQHLKESDKRGLKFTTTNYIMAIKDLCAMNILCTTDDKFEGRTIILFRVNEDIKSAINKLR